MVFDVTLGVRYHVIADVLRERIMTGVYPPGSPLPSELSLSFEFGHSRDTVRDALGVLCAEGLVIKERGRRAVIVSIAKRAAVPLAAGSTVTARMPMRPELAELGCRAETPVLVVTQPCGADTLHPADQVLLTVASPAASHRHGGIAT